SRGQAVNVEAPCWRPDYHALYVSGSARSAHYVAGLSRSGSGGSAPRGQSLLRSYLAARSFPPRPPGYVLGRDAHGWTVIDRANVNVGDLNAPTFGLHVEVRKVLLPPRRRV